MASDVCIERRRRRAFIWGCTLSLAAFFLPPSAEAEDSSPELIQPPVCSRATASDPALKGICEVTPLKGGHNSVKVNLIAQATPIEVGGYTVVTENYNANYLTPVVEAMPGDTVAAHLENLLPSRRRPDGQGCMPHEAPSPGNMQHGDLCENSTNLHYFHGGIVTPRNSRSQGGAEGDPKNLGDNIYAALKSGFERAGKPYNFEFNVPIPNELHAGVLESDSQNGTIPHPPGLNRYHSHLHGISSNQVMGGMSGLLSVGDAKTNVTAKCEEGVPPAKCASDTGDLKNRTEVRYVALRDIPLEAIGALPEEAKGEKAVWNPEMRDFPSGIECGVWKEDKLDSNEQLRRGFCQRDRTSAWLFTLNGQRFPTITVKGGHNLLLRLGNLSANVAYWLELKKEKDGTPIPLTILSWDGVVPVKPAGMQPKSINASSVPDLLLMPASRAEIYLRNDGGVENGVGTAHAKTQVYILRTKEFDTGADKWPEIQLARIVLKPNAKISPVTVALNAPIEQSKFIGLEGALPRKEAALPDGCVRDLRPDKREHRRVTFFAEDPDESKVEWSVLTEIMRPPRQDPDDEFEEAKFEAQEEATVGKALGPHLYGGIPFEDYEKKDGSFDWEGEPNKHVCIRLGSKKQLWVLVNDSGTLHNFHIHQMKFRLATLPELKDDYGIDVKARSHSCDPKCDPPGPDYKFYEEKSQSEPDWHDTIPVPHNSRVYLIMSFVAPEQVGRFVFHCHILKHEDRGLMAPIEIWNPFPAIAEN